MTFLGLKSVLTKNGLHGSASLNSIQSVEVLDCSTPILSSANSIMLLQYHHSFFFTSFSVPFFVLHSFHFQAAASMNVAAGYFCDPEGLEGLARLLSTSLVLNQNFSLNSKLVLPIYLVNIFVTFKF
jgi:hypothetical protein